MRHVLLFMLTVIALPSQALEDYDRLQIEKRIKPIGNVRVEGQSAAPSAATATPVAENKAPGQATYDQYCAVCHRDGLAGAPKFQNETDWKPRLAKEKNVEGLTAVAIKGLNAMPPKGTCTECSDNDIKEAVEYMLPKS